MECDIYRVEQPDAVDLDAVMAEMQYQVHDIGEAWEMAYAEKPYHDELAQERVMLAPAAIFALGRKAGEAAVSVQRTYRKESAVSNGEEEPEVAVAEAGPVEPVYIGRSDLGIFAHRHGYSKMTVGRTWSALTGVYYSQTSTSRVIEEAYVSLLQDRDNNGGVDAHKVYELMLAMFKDDGYKKAVNYPYISKFGPYSMSFVTDFLNHKLELEEWAQLPVLPKKD